MIPKVSLVIAFSGCSIWKKRKKSHPPFFCLPFSVSIGHDHASTRYNHIFLYSFVFLSTVITILHIYTHPFSFLISTLHGATEVYFSLHFHFLWLGIVFHMGGWDGVWGALQSQWQLHVTTSLFYLFCLLFSKACLFFFLCRWEVPDADVRV